MYNIHIPYLYIMLYSAYIWYINCTIGFGDLMVQNKPHIAPSRLRVPFVCMIIYMSANPDNNARVEGFAVRSQRNIMAAVDIIYII